MQESLPGSIPGSGRSGGKGLGHPLQYSWASLVAQLVKNPHELGRSPGEGKRLPTPEFWPREFQGLYSPWCCKESDTTDPFSLHFTSAGIESACMCRRPGFNPQIGKMPWRRKCQPILLAWKIPWTEKPGRLYSPWSRRVGHNLVTKPPPSILLLSKTKITMLTHYY